VTEKKGPVSRLFDLSAHAAEHAGTVCVFAIYATVVHVAILLSVVGDLQFAGHSVTYCVVCVDAGIIVAVCVVSALKLLWKYLGGMFSDGEDK
jgi:hypothetical protein